MSAGAHPFSRAAVKRDHLVRRRAVNRVMEAVATLAAFTAVAILAVVVWSVASRGLDAIDRSFFTEIPVPFAFGPVKTGIANAFIGSTIIVAIAALIALPFGVLVAVYLNEYAGRRTSAAIALSLDILNGIPSIVIGIFIFGLLVVGRGQSAFAASVALAIIMVPLVARSTQEVLRLVPDATREAGLALGATKARTTLSVVLPQTIGGILTGGTLAVARVAGETAPLLFTSSIAGTAIKTDPHEALATIPVTIFTYSESPNPVDNAQAWAAALSLILFILVLSLGSRALASRYRKRLGLTR